MSHVVMSRLLVCLWCQVKWSYRIAHTPYQHAYHDLPCPFPSSHILSYPIHANIPSLLIHYHIMKSNRHIESRTHPINTLIISCQYQHTLTNPFCLLLHHPPMNSNRPTEWRKIIAQARSGRGTLTFPLSKDQDDCAAGMKMVLLWLWLWLVLVLVLLLLLLLLLLWLLLNRCNTFMSHLHH